MAVPKKKTSKSKRNMRRSHDALPKIQSVECQNCGERRLPHHACSHCGWYKNRLAVSTKAQRNDMVDEEE